MIKEQEYRGDNKILEPQICEGYTKQGYGMNQ